MALVKFISVRITIFFAVLMVDLLKMMLNGESCGCDLTIFHRYLYLAELCVCVCSVATCRTDLSTKKPSINI